MLCPGLCLGDYIRGTIPFALEKLTPEIDRIEQLNEVLQGSGNDFVLIENIKYKIVKSDSAWSNPRIRCQMFLDGNGREFALLSRDCQ